MCGEHFLTGLDSQQVSAVLRVWAAAVLRISGFKPCNTVCGFAIAPFSFRLPLISHVSIICPRGIPLKHIFGIIMSEECTHTDGINFITYYLTCNVLDPFYVKNKQINGKYSLPRATAELLAPCIQFEVVLR